MKTFRFYSTILFLLLATCAHFSRSSIANAQAESASTRGDAQAELSALLPPPQRLEGTLEVTFSGVTTRGTLQFQAPDNLRIDIARDDAARIEAQTTIARGDDAQTFSEATGRLRARGFNAAQRPWRGTFLSDGGPANLALFGWPQNLAREYSLTIPDAKTSAAKSPQTPASTRLPAGARLITLTAKNDVGRRLQTDFTRAGGDNLLGLYAAYQRYSFDRPARITLALSANGAPLFREDFDAAGHLRTRTEFTADVKTRLPLSAITRDAKGRLVETWKYDLKVRDAAFDATVFALPESAREQILEDASTRAVSAFDQSDASDADAQWNRGTALSERAEDAAGALAAWGVAAKLKPRAVAPHFAIFRTALTTRNLALAAQSLEKLVALRGENDISVATRRVNLLLARRDFDGALKALEAAQKASPQNLEITLSRADVLRGLGEYSQARAALLDIVKSPNAQAETQAIAAQSLANLLAFDAEIKDDSALQNAAQNTIWLRLARAHFALLRGDKNTISDTKNFEAQPLALTSLALGFERAGRANDAIAAWEKLADSAFFVPGAGGANAQNVTAREHLVALGAARGEASLSVGAARDLMGDLAEENARRRIPDALLAAWSKAGKLGELGTALKQRAQGSATTEDDLKLWLAYQERQGTGDDISAIIRNGSTRFAKSAWWPSRLAELLSDRAASLSVSRFEEARKLFDDALTASTRAIKLEPSQPYYAAQNALIQTQKVLAVRKAPIVAPSDASAARDAATKLYDALLTKFPADADVALTVATARNALTVRGDAGANAAVFAALNASSEDDDGNGSDRHATVFFARQAAAMMMRQSDDTQGAAAQLAFLLLSARDAGEQTRIAVSFAQMLLKNGGGEATTSVVRLLAQLAGEAWPLESAQNAQQTLARVLVTRGLNTSKIDASPIVQVAQKLRAASDAPSVLAAAQLNFALLDAARELNAAADAPPAAERFLREGEQWSRDSESALQKIAAAPDGSASGTSRVLAARALVLLGERAGARGDWKEAATRLSAALRLEPDSVQLRVALARAFSGDGKNVEARRVRDDILRALAPTPQVLQRAAVVSAFSGDFDNALKLAQNAVDSGQAARGVSVELQAQTHLALADALFASGGDGAGRAAEEWKFVSGQSWPYVVRVAALLDAETHLRGAERTAEADTMRAQLTALDPSQNDLAAATDLINQSR